MVRTGHHGSQQGMQGLLASLLVAALPARTAFAQEPSINIYRPPVPLHPEATLATEPAAVLSSWTPHVGARVSYAREVVELRTTDGEVLATPLRARLLTDLSMNCGLSRGLSVGARLPIVAYQAGDETTSVVSMEEVPTGALGDGSLGAKLSIIERSPSRKGFGMAWAAEVSLPTGRRDSFAGDGQLNASTRLLGEYSLGRVSVRGALGGYWRPTIRMYFGEEFGSAATWAGSGMVRALGTAAGEKQLLASLDARGEIALVDPFAARAASPAFLGGTLRYVFGSWSAIAGPELPLSSAVGSAKFSVFVGVDWSPREADSDGDGINDEVDQCAVEREDIDGFEDHDGCPDVDGDHDGVADDRDACLPQGGRPVAEFAEDRDGFEDEDGCPDPDNDQDGILDADDQCPLQPGPKDGARRGCPKLDADSDGIEDANDKCRDTPEDADGFEDEDGCPDSDNDADGVTDAEDACVNTPGALRYPKSKLGCPLLDADRDTFEDGEDACVNQPEDFNGTKDDDGCPDAMPGEGGKDALVSIEQRGAVTLVAFKRAPMVVVDEDGQPRMDQSGLPSLRALARILMLDSIQQAVVLVRADAMDTNSSVAQTKAAGLVQRLNELARDANAAVVGQESDWAGARGYEKAGLTVLLRRRDDATK